jgi:hypothetical protein
VTWFLLGGDLYTAYTFIAVPALMYGAGAVGFFAMPYTAMIYPILYLVFPRLWAVAQEHGYVTASDVVRGQFGNRWLALAVAVTGFVATMPYIALQLVGLQVVIGAMGVESSGLAGDLPLIIAFAILAGFTYTSGLRAPAMIAIVKDPSDLCGRDRRCSGRADEAWWLLSDLRCSSAREADAYGAGIRYAGLLQLLCDAGAWLGARPVPLPALAHRHPQQLKSAGDPA